MTAQEKSSYRHVLVLGGHKLATSYAHKITQAKSKGALFYHDLTLVDPKANCEASKTKFAQDVGIKTQSYADAIAQAIKAPNLNDEDILIPDHTAKHVLLQLYINVAKEQSGKEPSLAKITKKPDTPFSYQSEDQTVLALSFATWTCPADCDEPAICPHTKSTRDWEMADKISDLKKILLSKESKALFHSYACPSFYEEICHIPLTLIRDRVAELKTHLSKNQAPVYVATHSHCHGIVGGIEF
ncbi:MAG: hypothetical protein H7A33_05560 [Deltaproteobacteria bacterium]|nr:hypothetical protein [Deltaproteobacteria bacterium]